MHTYSLTDVPLAFDEDAIRTLTDDELERELTISADAPEQRADRFDRLFNEWLNRRRGYRRHTDQELPVPS